MSTARERQPTPASQPVGQIGRLTRRAALLGGLAFAIGVLLHPARDGAGDGHGDELPEALASKANRLARLCQAKAQLEADAAARERAYQQRVATHTAAAAAKGKKPRQLKRRPQETPNPDAGANVTDPCSRFLHTRNGSVQGYNAQAVTTLE